MSSTLRIYIVRDADSEPMKGNTLDRLGIRIQNLWRRFRDRALKMVIGWLPALSFHSLIANDGSRLFIFFVSQHVPKADMPHMIPFIPFRISISLCQISTEKVCHLYLQRLSRLCFFVLLSPQLPFLFQRICQLLQLDCNSSITALCGGRS